MDDILNAQDVPGDILTLLRLWWRGAFSALANKSLNSRFKIFFSPVSSLSISCVVWGCDNKISRP